MQNEIGLSAFIREYESWIRMVKKIRQTMKFNPSSPFLFMARLAVVGLLFAKNCQAFNFLSSQAIPVTVTAAAVPMDQHRLKSQRISGRQPRKQPLEQGRPGPTCSTAKVNRSSRQQSPVRKRSAATTTTNRALSPPTNSAQP